MKKIGLIAGVSFLFGAIFFALTFGYLQKSGDTGKPVLAPSVVKAEGIGGGMSFAPLVGKVRPAVVKVTSESIVSSRGSGDDFIDRFFNIQPRRERVPGVGSGFFISSDGYILTNNHVVRDAVKVKVKTLEEKEYTAKVVGTDAKTDLALLKVSVKDVPYIQLGDSDKAEIGEWVLAIGNPFGQDLSVSAGIISAKGRQLDTSEAVDFIQTDAAINRGNSGGPLVNMEGRVIGITSQILSTTGGNIGLGFAIPSNIASKVVQDLKAKGRVIRGYLGISFQMLSETDAKDFDFNETGALILRVEKDSPADKIGLKKYDLLISIDGKKIKKESDLTVKMTELNPGDTVDLSYYRDKKLNNVKIKIGEAPESEKYNAPDSDNRSLDLGMVLMENSRSLAKQYDLKTSQGLVVRQIEPGSPAADAGLREGDVILEINGKEVTNLDEFRRIISSRKSGTQVMLFINRDGEEGMLRLRLPE